MRKNIAPALCLAAAALALSACNRGYKPYNNSGPMASPTDDDAFRSTFAVDKAKLVSTGNNLFFPLHPGSISQFKGGDETLTITVLNETRTVDGVETRIVEEREETPRGIKEISRNFFACDPETGDVYYFGEEVDIYKNGALVNHEGAWKSGENGARFGLMMPGVLNLGDRFYQEWAPGIAQDRCEVVSVSEQLDTPAGKFTSVAKLAETSPLERGTSHKLYAPGIGLIKDGDMVLTSRTNP